MGLRKQKDKAAQETCVNLGAEFRGPNCQSCLLFITAPHPCSCTSVSFHSFDLNLLSTGCIPSIVSKTWFLPSPPSIMYAFNKHSLSALPWEFGGQQDRRSSGP